MSDQFDDDGRIEDHCIAEGDLRNAEERVGKSGENGIGSNEAPAFRLDSFEVEMLRLASEGLVDKKAAFSLRLDPDRVHERWRRIRNVLGASTRTHAVAIAMSLGIIPPPEKVRNILSGRH